MIKISLFVIFVSIAFVNSDVIKIPLRKKNSERPHLFNLFSTNVREKLNRNEDLYFGELSIGTPAQKFSVILDTFFDDIWITSKGVSENKNLRNEYISEKSSTYTAVGQEVWNYDLDFGIMKGYSAYESIGIGNLTSEKQLFLETKQLYWGDESDLLEGILGLSPGSKNGKSFLRNLFDEKLIEKLEFSLSLRRKGESELVIGGVDPAHFKGDFIYVPISIDKREWSVPFTELRVGSEKFQIRVEYAVINTGTPFIYGPADTILSIVDLIGVLDTDYYNEIDCGKIDKLPSIDLVIDGKTFRLTGQDYVLKKKRHFDDYSEYCMLPFFPSGQTKTSGWFLGTVFLEKFYTTFDISNERMGFAEPQN